MILLIYESVNVFRKTGPIEPHIKRELCIRKVEGILVILHRLLHRKNVLCSLI